MIFNFFNPNFEDFTSSVCYPLDKLPACRYNTYRGWTQIEYQNKHYNIDQKDEGTEDDRRRDGGTNFILRIKKQETHLTLQELDDDDDDDDDKSKFN